MNSPWEDEVSNHPVHQALTEFIEFLDGYTVGEDLAQAEVAVIRARTVAGHVKERLEGIDPLLVSPQRLAQFQKQITAFTNEINAYHSDKSDTHVLAAHNHLDAMLDLVSRVPTISTSEDAKRLSESAVAFLDQTNRLISDLQQRAELTSTKITEINNHHQEVKNSLESTKQKIEEQKTRLDSAIAEFQKQFSDSQNSRQQSFAESEQQRLSTTQEEVRSWQEKLSALVERNQKAFDDLISSSQNEQKAAKAAAAEDTSNLLKDIESRRDKAKEIVGIIAGTGMAGGYQRDADQQRTDFKIWNWLTVLGFAGLIGFAVSLFFETVQTTEITWAQVGARLIAIVAFGAFAAYGGRMAMKHRESERQHRHKQLALESINAFLEDLEPEVQKQIKTKMAEVFFTQSEHSLRAADNVAPTTIDELFKLLNKMVDKGGR